MLKEKNYNYILMASKSIKNAFLIIMGISLVLSVASIIIYSVPEI